MKKMMLSIALMLVALGAMAEKKTVTLYIHDMECKNCQAKVENTLAFEKGVRSLDFDLEKRQVTITYNDEKTSVEKLQQALLKYNKYGSQVVVECETPCKEQSACCQKKAKKECCK